MEIPKLKCKGCRARDTLIKSLAKEIDRLEKENRKRIEKKFDQKKKAA